jgi:glycosyltransferase involved in cell wall biosynthesis
MKVNFVATGYTEDCGISTYTTSLENNLDIDTGRTELKLRSINVLHYVKKAIEAGQSEADIIHIQHEYGIYGPKSIASWLFLPIIWILTRSRDISIVLTLHTAWNKDSIDPPLILIKCVYVQMNNRVIAAIADHLIFLSENAQKKFEESVKYNSSIIIPHGVQTDVREFNHPKRIFGYKDSEPLVVLPGYVRPQKGYDVLLTIASKLPEISFLIAGGVQDESHNKYADKMQHAAPKNVKMSGILSEKQFHGAFAAADLVVLPYDSVTQSGILNWCVAYQIPVIASDRRYFNQFKDDCDGIKIFKSSSEATTLIRSIIENKSKKRKMEQAMSVYRESYSMNTISDNHIELYKKITKNKM